MKELDSQDLRALVRAVPDQLAVLDHRARIVWVNRESFRLIHQGAVGEIIDRLVDRSDRDRLRAAVEEALGGGEEGSLDIHRPGTTHLRCQILSLPQDPEGHPRVLVVTTDVSAIRRELEHGETSFRTLIESSPDLVLIVNGERRVIYANRSPSPESGLRIGDVLGRSLEDFVAPESRPALVEALDQLQRTGEMVRFQAASGVSPIRFDVTGVPLASVDGSESGALIVAHDVTEMVHAVQEQERLLAELDHRVKNTLTIVLALAHQSGQNAESVADFLDAFYARIRSLAVTHEALAASRWQSVSLSRIVRMTVSVMAHEPCQLERGSDDPELPVELVTPLAMVLHELTTNAVKHGAFSVDSGDLFLSARVRDGRLQLRWRERCAQPSGSSEGFGSSLVRRLVEGQMEGTLDVRVTPDERVYEIGIPFAAAPAGDDRL